jgi:hybrid cluster-associated redox disulfide protein
MKKIEITKDTTLAKILENPEAEEVLAKHGVPCVSCPYAKMEMDKLKLGEICKMYGIKLDDLLKDFNKNLVSLQVRK